MKRWLEEEEAGQILKRSRATLRRLAANNSIRTELQRMPGKARQQTMYHAGDVERLKGNPEEFVAATTYSASSSNLPAVRPKANLPALLQQPQQLPPAVIDHQHPPSMLTVEQASQVTGLPQGYIRQLIQEKRIKCLDWRSHYVSREALEEHIRQEFGSGSVS